MSKQPPVSYINPEDLDEQPYDFHPKVRAALEAMLASNRRAYEGVDLHDVIKAAKAQANVQQLLGILQLPKKIEQDERDKMKEKP